MPITSNGKVDKKALPNPDETAMRTKYVAPGNEIEAKLVLIWQELLKLEKIGVEDNFFELGGHSLLAMRMTSYIERQFLTTIPIQILFEFTTIKELSKYLELQKMDNLFESNSTTYELFDV